MGNQISPTNTFEEVLERGRRDLSTARDEYDALEQTETAPLPSSRHSATSNGNSAEQSLKTAS